MTHTVTSQRTRKRRAGLWIAGGLLFVCIAVLIHYRGVRPVLTREYGDGAPLAQDYTARDAALDFDDARPGLGLHVLNLKIGGVPTPVLLRVRDTVAPTAEARDREAAVGVPLGPDAFVHDLKDADVVRLTFADPPDFAHEGERDVTIRMTDRSGNQSTVTAHLSVRAAHPSITREAGAEPPAAADFLLEGVRGTLDRPITEEQMRHVGTTRVGVTTESGLHSVSSLIVQDTVAPQAEGLTLLLLPGETVSAEDCVTDVSDETTLIYTFLRRPDYGSRTTQTVTVRLTDEGGNTTDVQTTVLISGVRPKVIEARTEPLNAMDFQNEEGDEIEVPAFVPEVPGTFPVEIRTNGVEQTVAITVVDTTPPQVQETKLTSGFYTQHVYAPEAFFSATDLTGVTLSYVQEPDWEQAGLQTVSVRAEDACGNVTVMQRSIELLTDTNGPNIYGVIDRICYVNETIAYRKEVFAEDDVDGRVEVEVESEVDPHAEGVYRVAYRAKDRSGNETVCECTFTLIEQTVTEEEIRSLARQALSEITTPDMVDAEKLKAIFDYVQKQVKYANGVNTNYTDWRKAAYDGFTYGTGDCYNIYSVTRALLDETGIPYLSVERVKIYPQRTRHYWMHVNVGTGWYCYDPTWTPRHRVNCFMWTKQQRSGYRNYWNYDESKYPPLATTPFDYEAVVAMERQARQP